MPPSLLFSTQEQKEKLREELGKEGTKLLLACEISPLCNAQKEAWREMITNY